MKYSNKITEVALKLLTTCVDDYDTRIWNTIENDVIDDVLECSGIERGEGFTDGDVALAIGRAISSRLGLEI